MECRRGNTLRGRIETFSIVHIFSTRDAVFVKFEYDCNTLKLTVETTAC